MVRPAFVRIAGLDSIAFLVTAWLATYWPAVAAAAVLIRERGVMPPSVWCAVGAATAVASAILFLMLLGIDTRSSRHWYGALTLLRQPLALGIALFLATPIGLISGPLLRWWILQREGG
jgi:hypothetical protein